MSSALHGVRRLVREDAHVVVRAREAGGEEDTLRSDGALAESARLPVRAGDDVHAAVGRIEERAELRGVFVAEGRGGVEDELAGLVDGEARRHALADVVGAQLLVALVDAGARRDAPEQRLDRGPGQAALEVRPRRRVVEVPQPRESVLRRRQTHERKGEEIGRRLLCAQLLVEVELPVQRHRLRRRQHFLLALGQRVRSPAADRFDRVAVRLQLRLRGHELRQTSIGEREDLVSEEGALRVGVGFQRLAIVAALLVARVDGVAEVEIDRVPRQFHPHVVVAPQRRQQMIAVDRHLSAHRLQRLDVARKRGAIGPLPLGRREDAREVEVVAGGAVREGLLRVGRAQQHRRTNRKRLHGR